MNIYGSRASRGWTSASSPPSWGSAARRSARRSPGSSTRASCARVPRKGVFVVRKTKRRDRRDDHGVGGPREHGGAADHRARERCRDRHAAPDVRDLRGRSDQRAHRRVFRDEHRASTSASSQHEPLRALVADGGEPVHPRARDPAHARSRENHRVERSIIDHMHIIEALETRDAELAERLVREHTLGLAAHVENERSRLSGTEAGRPRGAGHAEECNG